MADILPFRQPKTSDKHRGNTLCRGGHHKWIVEKTTVFDSKQGRLVTRFRCERCDEIKVKPI